jgi:hypothetical protein
MRNLIVIGGICILAIAVGAWLYFGTPHKTAPATSASTEAPVAKEVHFAVLDQGDQAGDMTTRKNYAIYDAAEFARFWQKAHPNGKKVPNVDFKSTYVIAVFAGTEPTGGYRISVTKVTDTANARSVAVTIEQPDSSCAVVEEETSPYAFVTVPYSDAEALSHTDVRTTHACNTP